MRTSPSIGETPTHINKKLFNNHERYPYYSHIYTDNSKDNNRIGYGAVYKNTTAKNAFQKKLQSSLVKPAL